jgi:hypothetical protein
MIRAELAAGSPNAMMLVTPGKGANFQRRLLPRGISNSTAGALVKAPCWVKLTRAGNTITAYQSADGLAWTQVGAATTIDMPPTVFVGLAVSSHAVSRLATATFDHVSMGQ